MPEADAWEAWFISPAGAPEGCAEGQVSCFDEVFEPGEGCVDAGGVAEVFHLFYVGSAHVGQQEWIEGIMFGFPFVCVFHVEPAAHGEAFGRKAAVLSDVYGEAGFVFGVLGAEGVAVIVGAD